LSAIGGIIQRFAVFRRKADLAENGIKGIAAFACFYPQSAIQIPRPSAYPLLLQALQES
jgi:hypothetical protein